MENSQHNIDQLLSSIRAAQTSPPPTDPAAAPPSETSPALPIVPHSVDDLLTQLQGTTQGSPQQSSQQSSQQSFQGTSAQENASSLSLKALYPLSAQSSSVSPAIDLPVSPTLPVLEDLKTEFLAQQQQREAETRREQERLARQQEQERLAREREEARLAQERAKALEQARREEEERAKAKKAQAEKEAQAWLSQLQPLSGETLWFEEFAQHYPSRLAAAIVYLNLDT